MAELQALVGELRKANTGLRDVVAGKDDQIAAQDERLASLQEWVAALGRRRSATSSPSSRPPSSDNPCKKPDQRSSRLRSGRKPGKQPGDPGTTLPLVDDPDEIIDCQPGQCPDGGADVADGEVLGMQRRKVFDTPPPPPRPHVTEYR